MADELRVLPRPADEAAWLALRKPYSNCSSAAVHVREHEYMTIADWYVEKRTDASKVETRAMTRGKELEAAMRQWYAREQDLTIDPIDVLFVRGRLMGTPDGVVIYRGGQRVNELIEVKASPGKRGRRARYWQCVALLACSYSDAVHLVELHPGDYVPTYLHRDDPGVAADIARLMAGIELDWSYVDVGEPPPDAVFDADQAFDLWELPSIAKVDLPTPQYAIDLRQARADKKLAEMREKAAKDALANLMRDAEIGLWMGEPIVSWKANKPSVRFQEKEHERTNPVCHAWLSVEKPGARVMKVVGEPAVPTEDEVGF